QRVDVRVLPFDVDHGLEVANYEPEKRKPQDCADNTQRKRAGQSELLRNEPSKSSICVSRRDDLEQHNGHGDYDVCKQPVTLAECTPDVAKRIDIVGVKNFD